MLNQAGLRFTGIIDHCKGTVPARTNAQTINYELKITNLPRVNTSLAGSSLKITVANSSRNAIMGARFTYTPARCSPVSTSVTLTNLVVYGTSKPVTASYEFPIAALALNMAGDFNGNNSAFTFGAGAILYEPKYSALQDGTGETSNNVYGPLPPSNSTSVRQTGGIEGGVPKFGPARKPCYASSSSCKARSWT